MAVAGLGLGPVGAAFYFWDYGVKHGDIRVLGAAAYTAPLLSTLSLVAFGLSKATPALWTACALITIGADPGGERHAVQPVRLTLATLSQAPSPQAPSQT